MIPKTSLSFVVKDAERKFRAIRRDERKYIARGINQGTKQLRTVARKETRARRNVKAKVVNAQVKQSQRANATRLQAKIRSRGGPLPLATYGARVQRGRGRRKKGASNTPVAVAVAPGQKKIVNGAFVRNSDGMVLRRQGAARYPLHPLQGPALYPVLRERAVIAKIRRKWGEIGPRLINQQLQILINKQGAG